MALHETFRISDAAPQKMAGRLQGLRRRGRLVLYGLGVLVLLLLAWHFLGPLFAPKRKAPPPPPVKVAMAQRRDITVTQKTIGTVVSPATVQVTAQVTGKLLAANFHEGDIVHKGQLLFQIDPAPYQAAEAQAEGQLARDAATLQTIGSTCSAIRPWRSRMPSPISSWRPRPPRSSRTRAWWRPTRPLFSPPAST